MVSVFANLNEDKLPSIFTNPNLPSERLFSRWENDDISSFLKEAGTAKELLARLDSAKGTDWRESIKVLKKLFGNELLKKVFDIAE